MCAEWKYIRTECEVQKRKVNEPKLFFSPVAFPFKNVKSKVIPLHAMEVHGVRRGIAPTHS
jgi:hypothetical protein